MFSRKGISFRQLNGIGLKTDAEAEAMDKLAENVTIGDPNEFYEKKAKLGQ